ncbi:sugar ABC transporter permease [Clostridiaceae bacterium UIB06]|uniref:Xylose transport system permease protein XylH n=1 Tax=Clostridium thailandense TaxID=2794346 RepID=A0A949WSF9_9CLOT|nr:sugar ABC transporter permease [Clostridium thailandense]MBV7275135.1 sugar ABC transporter permease [Clostridium thailandense]MCH5137372.1 sugar ABC transporter permease [Clostridiaceae bacterium UIB06]
MEGKVETVTVKNKTKKSGILKSKMYTMLIALVVIWAIFTVTTGGNFLSTRNLSNLLRQMSTTGILAIGMVFVIILGEIDLSVGSMLGLLGGIAAILNVWFNMGAVPTIIITLILGLVLGFWNGFWVAYKKVPSFIVTLAGMLVFRGILIGISKGNTIAPLSESMKVVGQSYFPNVVGYVIAVVTIVISIYLINNSRKKKLKYGLEVAPMRNDIIKVALIGVGVTAVVAILNDYSGFPLPVFIMGIFAIVFSYMASSTVFGRRIYAIGGNKEAAKLSGINVNKQMLMIYAFNGLLAAIAGILLTSRLNAGSVSAGTNAELDAIASCVIGGASLAGGTGSVAGALVGALVMATIDNGMSMLNTQPFWQYIVKGLILLLAVWVDIRSKDKK